MFLLYKQTIFPLNVSFLIECVRTCVSLCVCVCVGVRLCVHVFRIDIRIVYLLFEIVV